ncbi:hypothetical protein D8674_011991 [Pyrus ussuriensis x Pyrus communis]|uniref:Aminotransferase-like plant mobile domain-containing protein n=1 Tax=Pyrus ussuriensis x Pyrus communis TaxID=2448454 RepID=A0A5N5G0E7_9ROSA|nr:hypothetical protein D8674_011991 [Pyrus ussuriensis x Pyrus communis]
MTSNIFITKLSEECTKCKDFIGRNAIKTLRFEEWKSLGTYDAIKLSTVEIVMDRELLMEPLSFWCSATNTMVLPLGPISLIVHDISAIFGTCPSGFPVDTVLPGYQFDLDLKSLFDKCVKFCLRPNVLETHSARTFVDWWDAYIQEFFDTPVEYVIKKLFGDRPRKTPTPKSKKAAQADHPIKRVDAATTATAKKKPAPPKKAATIQIPVASPTPMVATFVPRLFLTFLSLFLALAKGLQNPPLDHATNVYPTLPGIVKPIVAPLVEGFAAPRVVVSPIVGPSVATMGEAATLAEKNLPPNPKKKSIVVVEEETKVGHEAVPLVETEAMADTPIHPQDQNLECLNDLASDGLLSNECVVHLSTVVERTRQYFIVFEKDLQAEDDLKAAMVTHKAI